MVYDIDFLRGLSNEQWKAAAKRGAEYILEMKCYDFYTYSASMCAMIGLVCGAGPKMLLFLNWIDDIIINYLKQYPIRAVGNFIDTRDMEAMTDATQKAIWDEFIRNEVYPPESKQIFTHKFPYLQSLREVYNNPNIR